MFQERAHIVTLTADLVRRLLDALEDWADEITEVTADWTTTADVGLTVDIRRMLEHLLADGRARMQRSDDARPLERPAVPTRATDPPGRRAS